MYAAAVFYHTTGDLQQSIYYFDHAVDLDPLNKTLRRVRFGAFVGTDRYAEEVSSVPRMTRCEDEECANLPAMWALTMASIAAADEVEMKKRRDEFREISGASSTVGQWVKVMSTHVDSLLGEPIDPAFWENVDFSETVVQESALNIASILAQHGEQKRALDLLFSARESTGVAFSNTEDFFALSPGRLEVPESLRRHPRYHEYWDLPGMAELADARRANGMPYGLPLPPKDPE